MPEPSRDDDLTDLLDRDRRDQGLDAGIRGPFLIPSSPTSRLQPSRPDRRSPAVFGAPPVRREAAGGYLP